MKERDIERDTERNSERERMREREGWNETEEGEREREVGEGDRERERYRQTVMGKEGMCPVVVLKQVCDWDNLQSRPHRKVLVLTQSHHQALNWYMY